LTEHLLLKVSAFGLVLLILFLLLSKVESVLEFLNTDSCVVNAAIICYLLFLFRLTCPLTGFSPMKHAKIVIFT